MRSSTRCSTRGVERITVVNRTPQRAEVLRQRFGERLQVAPWEQLNDLLGDAALFVNTTTLGMAGQPELEVDIGRLPSHAIVADLVYVPLVTPLIEAAKAEACAPPTGSACCCIRRCAVLQLWFGKKPASNRGTAGPGRGRSWLPPASAPE